jgi:adenylate cyclase
MPVELSPKEIIQKEKMERELAGLETTWKARGRRVFARLPSDPRCTLCLGPFEGVGGKLVSMLLNKRPSAMNPLFCNHCEEQAMKLKISFEVEMSLLFADIRASTPLAEELGPATFTRMVDRFYTETTHVLIHSYAIIDKLAGDQVSGYYLPGLAGEDFAKRAVEAATELLRATGHTDAGGPWVPVGVGVNTGEAVFGVVGPAKGMQEVTALGDAANVAARLASNAATGEALISESTARKAGLDTSQLELRSLALKGKREPMNVWVMSFQRNGEPGHQSTRRDTIQPGDGTI